MPSVVERDPIRRLSSELAKQHRLVEAEGVTLAGAQRLSLYRFRHMLVRKYLDDQIDVVERSQLHEDLGHILEGLLQDRLDDVTVQLAWHFTEELIRQSPIRAVREWPRPRHQRRGRRLLHPRPSNSRPNPI